MNLLLFIVALSGGINGDFYSEREPIVYMIPEAGFKMEDAYLTASLYTEIDPYNLREGRIAESFENNILSLQMYIDTDYMEYGIRYQYFFTENQEDVTIFFKLRSWE